MVLKKSWTNVGLSSDGGQEISRARNFSHQGFRWKTKPGPQFETYLAWSETPTSLKADWMSRRVEYSETEADKETEELKQNNLKLGFEEQGSEEQTGNGRNVE